MQNYKNIILYAGLGIIALLLAGLAGWYFFLTGQTEDIATSDAARGFTIAVPSFSGARSSTAENITGGSRGESLLFQPQQNARPPRLWKVSQSPVAGMGWLATSTTLRYIERSTGHVYDADPVQGGVTRRTNTLLPKIYTAHILSDGGAVLQTLDETGAPLIILGRVSTTTTNGFSELDGTELGGGISAVAPSPLQPEMLLVAPQTDGSGTLIRSTSRGDTPESIMTLPLSNLQPLLLGDGRMFVSERPASGVFGSAYEVIRGTLRPLVRAIPGLVAVPRANTTALLYSSDDGTRLRLFARPSENASFSEFSLGTTAAKCVWAPAASTTSLATAYCAASQTPPSISFTDRWLRGQIHSEDAWFRLDVSAAKTDRFFAPESSVAIDVERPMMDASGNYITFINARDKSLWVLRIAQ